jgi:hypothetical protein
MAKYLHGFMNIEGLPTSLYDEVGMCTGFPHPVWYQSVPSTAFDQNVAYVLAKVSIVF